MTTLAFDSMMAAIGTIETFDPIGGEWTSYAYRLDLACGETYRLLESLLAPEKAGSKDYDPLCKRIQALPAARSALDGIVVIDACRSDISGNDDETVCRQTLRRSGANAVLFAASGDEGYAGFNTSLI